MADEIPPALTPDEWAHPPRCVDASETWGALDDDWVRAMAIANFWMSDDDPRKITRADVADLHWALANIQAEPGSILHEYLAGAQRLKAKLAALLPPE